MCIWRMYTKVKAKGEDIPFCAKRVACRLGESYWAEQETHPVWSVERFKPRSFPGRRQQFINCHDFRIPLHGEDCSSQGSRFISIHDSNPEIQRATISRHTLSTPPLPRADRARNVFKQHVAFLGWISSARTRKRQELWGFFPAPTPPIIGRLAQGCFNF